MKLDRLLVVLSVVISVAALIISLMGPRHDPTGFRYFQL